MKKLYLAGLAVIVGLVSASAAATGPTPYTVRFHGSVCTSTPSYSYTTYSQYGIYNLNDRDTPVTVTCPLPLSTVNNVGTALTGAQITYYDRSDSIRVSCTLQALGPSGNVVYSEQQTSGWSEGGSNTLSFNPSNVNPQAVFMVATCTIPGKGLFGGTLQPSYITSITVTEQ